MGRQVEEQYINKDLVRFGYLHFTILGSESVLAAQASECAADQSLFWPYHDLLFENQAKKNTGGFSKENLKRFAGELGMDPATFSQCLDSNSYVEIIQQQTRIASSLGFQGTPAFIINGKPLFGAQPFEVFKKTIDEALQEVSLFEMNTVNTGVRWKSARMLPLDAQSFYRPECTQLRRDRSRVLLSRFFY